MFGCPCISQRFTEFKTLQPSVCELGVWTLPVTGDEGEGSCHLGPEHRKVVPGKLALFSSEMTNSSSHAGEATSTKG